MFKRITFQLHWFFGITAGFVLALMGVTGALYSFEDELLGLFNPGTRIELGKTGVVPLPELVKRLEAAGNDRVSAVFVMADGAPSRVFFQPPPGERRGASRYFNAFTGELLPGPAGEAFFDVVLQLHRFLALGPVGRQITGACTLILIFFCVSGLYLRWPRQALNWRAWLTLDRAKKGRAFNWDLHATAGTWCLALYLLAGLTGLFWSYEWYRQGATALLSSAPSEQRRQAGGPVEAPDYAMLWRRLNEVAGPGLTRWTVRASAKGQPLSVSYLTVDAAHPRAFDLVEFEPVTGRIVREQRYASKPFGERILASVYALHTGEYFGLVGRLLMMLASVSMPVFLVTGWLLYLDRRRKQREMRRERGVVSEKTGGWLVGFASQSGQAERLAWMTAGQLQAAGHPVQVRPLGRIDANVLREANRALFVISTFGDGEPPDGARLFERRVLGQSLALGNLQYALLALGDRRYTQFCGFARRVEGWLRETGARPFFPLIEVDDGDASAVGGWQRQLVSLTGSTSLPATEPGFSPWTLLGREHLNPGSQGGPTYLLRLQGNEAWSAGDILEVQPRHADGYVQDWLMRHGLDPETPVAAGGSNQPLYRALADRALPDTFDHLVGLQPQALVGSLVPLGTREYSIASIMADGAVELIVRQARRADGRLGVASGWLTETSRVGGTLIARVRRNSAFHVPEYDCPLILIGNGTGLSGLRALLKARRAAGLYDNWLLFGERNRQTDFYCRQELEGALQAGDLAYLDLAFSRDGARAHYVQHCLAEQAERVSDWVERGAHLYVCGSQLGMAEDVDRTLRTILGNLVVDEMRDEGRYRRDVY